MILGQLRMGARQAKNAPLIIHTSLILHHAYMHHTLMHRAHMHNDQGAYVYASCIHASCIYASPRITFSVGPSVTEKFRIIDA